MEVEEWDAHIRGTGSRRTTPLPSDWPKRRARILARDRWRCRLCGDLASDVDHIVPASMNGDDDDDNLMALCARCHRSKTGREAQRLQELRRKHQEEKHPGFIDSMTQSSSTS